MRITSADLAMLDVAHRTCLRTAEPSRHLVEAYIDWLTDQLAQEAAAGHAAKDHGQSQAHDLD